MMHQDIFHRFVNSTKRTEQKRSRKQTGSQKRRRRMLSELLETRQLLAADYRVLDINQNGDSLLGRSASIGTDLFFRDTDPAYGAELFRLDTLTNTRSLVADINPGLSDSYAGEDGFATIGSKLFFTAYDDTVGSELRWFDTANPSAGVQTLDINEGSDGSNVGDYGGLHVVGNKLFFTARAPTLKLRWIDASETTPTLHTAAISPAFDEYPGMYGGFITVGNKLYFTAYDLTNGMQLRWIDTELSEPVVNSIVMPGEGNSSSPPGRIGGFHLVANKLFFTAQYASDGLELRWIDTTSANPSIQSIPLATGTSSAFVTNPEIKLASASNKLFIITTGSETGFFNYNKLRWIDATLASPSVNEITLPTSTIFQPNYKMHTIGNYLYVAGSSPANGNELFWLDHTQTSPTAEVINIAPGTASSNPSNEAGYATLGSKLYFTTINASNVAQLRWIDTSVSPSTVFTVQPDNTNYISLGNPGGLIPVGNRLYFAARDTQQNVELGWIDSALASPLIETVLLQSSSGSNPGSSGGSIRVGNKVYFGGVDSVNGSELRWIDESLDPPTLHVLNINPNPGAGSFPGSIGGFYNVGSKLFFSANSPLLGTELRWIDTSLETPVLNTIDVALDAASSNAGNFGGFIESNNKLFFVATDATNGYELRWIDLSLSNPPVNTLSLVSGSGNAFNNNFNFTKYNNRVFFTATDATNGTELRWLDASLASPVINTINVAAGSASSLAGAKMIVVGNKLFFTATDTTNGNELRWIDAGATTPTVNTLNLNAGSAGSDPSNLTSTGNRLYFSATDSTNGVELRWLNASSTSPSITTINFETGSASSSPQSFFIDQGWLYFNATRSVDGSELRRVSTSNSGTNVQTISVAPDTTSSYGGNSGYAVSDNRLFFSAEDSESGNELRWIYRNEAIPQVHSLDIASGQASANPGANFGFVVIGDSLFTSATKPGMGTEVIQVVLNHAPSGISLDSLSFPASVPGNGAVAMVQVDDADPIDQITIQLVAGTGDQDNSKFFTLNDRSIRIDPSIKVSPGDSFQIRVRATDQYGASVENHFVLTAQASPNLGFLDLDRGGAPTPTQYAELNNKIYFNASDSQFGNELHVYDKTTGSETTLDLNPGLPDSFAGKTTLYASGSKLFFDAYHEQHGQVLHFMDTSVATPSSQVLLTTNGLPLTASPYQSSITTIGDRLFFYAGDSQFGFEPRWLDLSASSPVVQTIDLYVGTPSSTSSGNTQFLVNGDFLYFTATSSAAGTEMRRVDTSQTPPSVHTFDFRSGSTSGTAENTPTHRVGTKIYFPVFTATQGAELGWIDTSLPSPTIQTVDVNPGSGSSSPSKLTSIGDRLYFTTVVSSNANVRWLDTTQTTPTIQSLGSTFTEIHSLWSINDQLVFDARDGANGREIRYVNPFAVVPEILTFELNPGVTNGVTSVLGVNDGHLYFVGSTPTMGQELRRLDVTTDPPELESLELTPGSAGSSIGAILSSTDGVYLQAAAAGNVSLYRSNSASIVPSVVAPLTGNGGSFPSNLTAIGNKLYFWHTNSQEGTELGWINTQDPTRTLRSAVLNPGTASSKPSSGIQELIPIGERLFFFGTSPANGLELNWININSDFPEVQTIDLTAGTTSSNIASSSFAVAGTKLFFWMTDANGSELRWVDTSETTPTLQSFDLAPGSASSLIGGMGDLTLVNNRLYFMANTSTAGSELRWLDLNNLPSGIQTMDVTAGTGGITRQREK